ncbi:NADH-cytochrome B5 reductase, putative [Talaromyces stipitatus ATCC 10500]|uniref:NADH-cytochrome b5 reductase n=1 Tax=Talaromyces stipitatus (strain ATCC 10500 / CBS 375.48 / QM 6759 / NRRL 1006) TaxID=441959 RepID=B8MJW2_TALSN|nr:NADH-cytochrome B5 reductase, putative [Talaromyces stipitatus ATCC 10500]EED14779.1 NADH-cytochrome B5 reductase, putative [Talaromyces stipitatus ATCC 10500]
MSSSSRFIAKQATIPNLVIGIATAGGLYTAYSYIRSATSSEPRKTFGNSIAGSLTLQQTEEINHNTKRLRFSFPNARDETGLTVVSSVLTFSWPKGSLAPAIRPYTPVSNLSKPGFIDLMVKKYPGGKVSTHLHSLQPGDSLFFAFGIKAYSWIPNKHDHITLIAGGAGITPIYQLIQGILDNPEDRTKMTLVFGVNTERDILLRKEFENYGSKFPDRFKVVYTVSEPEEGSPFRKGHVTKELLKEVLPARTDKVFVCGPPGLETALTGKGRGDSGILGELGYKKDQIFKF